MKISFHSTELYLRVLVGLSSSSDAPRVAAETLPPDQTRYIFIMPISCWRATPQECGRLADLASGLSHPPLGRINQVMAR